MATTGNAIDFGDISSQQWEKMQCLKTRGVLGGVDHNDDVC